MIRCYTIAFLVKTRGGRLKKKKKTKKEEKKTYVAEGILFGGFNLMV